MHRRRTHLISLFFALFVSLAANAAEKVTDLRPTVLRISIDGFRPVRDGFENLERT